MDGPSIRVNFSKSVYVISVAAELAGMHPQTLRIYERKGLLEPARTSGGSRRYSDVDIARLHRIAELTEAGVNLEGVKRILELEAEAEGLRQELREVRLRAEEMVARVRRERSGDLVPLSQDIVPMGFFQSFFRDAD